MCGENKGYAYREMGFFFCYEILVAKIKMEALKELEMEEKTMGMD